MKDDQTIAGVPRTLGVPTALELRNQIATAKIRKNKAVYQAVEDIVAEFSDHVRKLVENPYAYTNHTLWSTELPGIGYKFGADKFVELVRERLAPAGYDVEKSHDGVGIHSNIVIRWDLLDRPRTEPRRPSRFS